MRHRNYRTRLEATFPFSPQECAALNAQSATPLYAQLKQLVEDRIRGGDFVYGDDMPAAQEFSSAFGVSIVTVQRAIKMLADDGLVKVRRGSMHTKVLYREKPNQYAAKRLTLSSSHVDFDGRVSLKTLRREIRVPPTSVSRQLGLSPMDEALFTTTVESDRLSRIAYGETWTVARGDDVSVVAFLAGSTASEDLGVQRIEQRVAAGRATIPAVRELKLDVGEPVMHVERSLHGIDDKPIQVSTYQCSANRFRLETDQRL